MLRGAMPYLFETDEHAAIRATARKFAQVHIAPHGAAWEEDEGFPVELYRTAADAGMTGIGYPEAVGGQGGDLGQCSSGYQRIQRDQQSWSWQR